MVTQESTGLDSIKNRRSGEGMALLALTMSAFVLNLNANVMGALLPFLKEDFDFDVSGGSRLLSAGGFGAAFGALLLADFVRRWSPRTVLVTGMGVFAVSSLAHVFVTGFWPLLGLRVVAAFATGVAYAVSSAVAADMTPYERRGAVMGRFNAGMFLAIPVGIPLAAWLANSGMWEVTFVVQAAVGVVGVLLSLRFVPALPPTATARRLPLLRNGGVVAILVATMLHVGSFFTVVQMGTLWLDSEGIVAKENHVWVWIGLGGLSVVGSAAFGRVADRIGKRMFVLITSAILVVSFLVLSRGPGPWLLLAVGCVLAMAAAARTGPLQALVSGLVPSEQMGALMGLRGFCMQIGVGAFAFGASQLTRNPKDFDQVFMLAAACQFLSYAAIRFGVRERQKAG